MKDKDAPPEEAGFNSSPRQVLFDPRRSLGACDAPLLAEHVRFNAKPIGARRCGIELELFGYAARTLDRLSASQVRDVLAELARSEEDLVRESESIVEARLEGGGRATVEPGGQIEFSSAPRFTLAELERDVRDFLSRLREIAQRRALLFIAAGFDPIRSLDEQRWYPKRRYQVLRPYLARHGRRALDMMARTCAVQINLDYTSTEELGQQFALANMAAPFIAALAANAPFEGGAPSGYRSVRALVWTETDPDRCGPAPAAFADTITPETLVAYAQRVPMIFVRRDGHYLRNPQGRSFAEFLFNPPRDIEPRFQDWTDHLSTIFTNARLRSHLELRAMDGNRVEMALALAALWRGLLYDRTILNEARRRLPRLRRGEMLTLERLVAREGLLATTSDLHVFELARDLVALAAEGLRRVASDEERYLDPLKEALAERASPADMLLRNWEGSWHKKMAHVIAHLRVA